MKRAVAALRAKQDPPLPRFRTTVLDGVFHQRLQEEAGDGGAEGLGRTRARRSTVREADLLDREVVVDGRELLSQGTSRRSALSREWRSRSPRCAVMRRATFGSFSTKAEIAFRVLKRK
jgi:hypothetical protein